MLSVGVDIADIARIARALERWNDRFLAHVYTDAEVAYCRAVWPNWRPVRRQRGHLQGTGHRPGGCFVDRDGDPGRSPRQAHGGAQCRALARAEYLGLSEWAISLSHDAGKALAFVVANGQGPTGAH
jgi:holo-[acyl-carrier protein] synthase